jgi:hypothetical protein
MRFYGLTQSSGAAAIAAVIWSVELCEFKFTPTPVIFASYFENCFGMQVIWNPIDIFFIISLLEIHIDDIGDGSKSNTVCVEDTNRNGSVNIPYISLVIRTPNILLSCSFFQLSL